MTTHYVVALYKKLNNSFDSLASFGSLTDKYEDTYDQTVTEDINEAETLTRYMNQSSYSERFNYVVKEIDL